MDEQDFNRTSGQQVYFELEKAVQDLSTRGLHTAARWAAEQINGLDPSIQESALHAASTGVAPVIQLDPTDRHPQYMLARQHFEFKVARYPSCVVFVSYHQASGRHVIRQTCHQAVKCSSGTVTALGPSSSNVCCHMCY